MARTDLGITVKPGQRTANPTDPWSGAVTFPNGAVYFPTGDYFILPNGYKIRNSNNAKAEIEKYLKEPKAPNGGIQYPPGQAPRGDSPVKGVTPGGGLKGSTPKGQPGGGGTPPSQGPPPAGGGGTPATPPWLMTDGPQGPGTGGNFSKGQPRYDQTAGGQFMPFLEQFYGQQGGFNPYAGGMGQGGPGYGGGGWGSAGGGMPNAGNPRYYDPLGIGKTGQGQNFYGNYMDDQADYYPMVGVNSVTGYSGMDPRYGLVGGQGGYGIGMVGPDYSGPLWNQYPDLNLLLQRAGLTQIQTAQQSPEALPAPQQSSTNTTTSTTNNNTNGSSTVNAPSKGQPGQQTQQQTQQPGNAPHSYYESGVYYGTPYGQLVQSNSGNGNLAKSVNGGDQQYSFNPQTGQWQMATQGQLSGAESTVNPMQYAPQAGAAKTEYQQKNGFWQAKPGTGTYR